MMRILLVEDERIVALALKHELANLGYEVVAMASNAADALDALHTYVPDVVVMDVMIEGDIDGIEAARIMAQTSAVPILYLTGEAEPSTQLRAHHSPNIIGYLLKPVHPESIAQIIRQINVESPRN
jgi:CheY-like chemotaxis protein